MSYVFFFLFVLLTSGYLIDSTCITVFLSRKKICKDAFREAKANGFGVTVIRKGELKLNVDQTLEEVEEQITEIGSKMYHDMIMKERSVDISSLMNGVLGLSNTPKRRYLLILDIYIYIYIYI